MSDGKIKVKELKDDAIVAISVNKTYYLMVKQTLFTLFTALQKEGVTEDTIKNIANKPYQDLGEIERSFYTTTLLLAEIERQAVANELFIEKEVDLKKAIEQDSKD
jgi:hypothetical protein